MNPPGGNRPPGPPGAWPGHGVPPTQQVPYGHAQPQGTYPAPPQPYPPQQHPHHPPPQQHGYPPQQQGYPHGYAQPPQQHGYPGYPPAPQMIVVQNHVPGYGVMAPDARKKDTALILAILGFFFGICGMQRFYLRQTGMGLLYLFTGGLCAIGQIIDIIQLATMSQQEFDMRYNVMR